ncbi:MAG: aminotransferase class IV, partial [Rhodospirillaceae bacterium]|nr:aminotransferase class IV [Rhodospirillaceae bacterium]
LAKKRGIEIVERVIMPDELANATQVFLTGTAAEVTPVGAIDNHTYNVGEITTQLMDDYDKTVGKKPANASAAE